MFANKCSIYSPADNTVPLNLSKAESSGQNKTVNTNDPVTDIDNNDDDDNDNCSSSDDIAPDEIDINDRWEYYTNQCSFVFRSIILMLN